jgi:hypothetical protein
VKISTASQLPGGWLHRTFTVIGIALALFALYGLVEAAKVIFDLRPRVEVRGLDRDLNGEWYFQPTAYGEWHSCVHVPPTNRNMVLTGREYQQCRKVVVR